MNKALICLSFLAMVNCAQAAGALTLLTPPLNSPIANTSSRLADASWNGRYVLVESRPEASSSVPQSGSLLLHDRVGGTVETISALHASYQSPPLHISGQSDIRISQDGRFIVANRQSGFVGVLLRFDRASGLVSVLANAIPPVGSPSARNYAGFSPPQISLTGRQAVAAPLLLTVAPLGAPFISGNEPGPVLVANTLAATVPDSLPAEAGNFQVSADGQQLFFKTAVQSFRLSLATGLTLPLGRTSQPLLLSADGHRVAMVRDDAPDKVIRLELASAPASPRLQILASNLAEPRLAGISSTGEVVVIHSVEGVTVWNDGRTDRVASPLGPDADIRIATGPDGRLLAWTSSAGNELALTDRFGQLLAEVRGASDLVIDRVIVTRLGAAIEARGTPPGLEAAHSNRSNVYFLAASLADADPSIALQLEQPAQGAPISGVTTIRGWAFASEPIETVSLNIDGVDYGALPHGGPRQDVADAFPDQPGADRSGFSAAFNFNELGAGYHRMVVTATDRGGRMRSSTADFVVAPAADTFLPRVDQVDLVRAGSEVRNGEVVLRDVQINGAIRSLVLGWSPASQSFEIVEVR